jgi:[ribosomal protein S5]-alanine N-acetyltransferase
MQLPPTLHWTTEHIELFLLEPEHVGPAYVGWLNDRNVTRFLESRFLAHTEQSTREFVRLCLDHPRTLFLGIRSRAHGDRHVGNIKLAPIEPHHGLGEVGILIGERSVWGQGIGSGAIAALANIARNQLNLRKLTAGCYATNLGSRRAFVRAGFEVEGERRAHVLLDGQPEDLILMAKWLD